MVVLLDLYNRQTYLFDAECIVGKMAVQETSSQGGDAVHTGTTAMVVSSLEIAVRNRVQSLQDEPIINTNTVQARDLRGVSGRLLRGLILAVPRIHLQSGVCMGGAEKAVV